MLKSKAPDGPKKTLNTGGKLIMTYDFETLVSRKNMGSSKWMRMLEANPNVADDVDVYKRQVHARGKKTKVLAFRPGLCEEIRL